MSQAPPESQPQANPAWTRSELSDDPHASAEKAEKIRRMFGAIAGMYDFNNRVHSFGRDQAWRRAAIRAAGVTPETQALDVACGTGDLTRLLSHAGARHVTGADFTPEMLEVAQAKSAEAIESGAIEYVQADAMALPFEDRSFDVVTIAFGIRNVEEPKRALQEFQRVLKSGGRLVILEFSEPEFAPVRWLNRVYTRVIMPRTATLFSRDRSGAYYYLPRSIDTFLDREAMASALREASFMDVSMSALTLGVCVCHRAIRR
jgi:demethylmenaquinone methyltransferase/2-methoxy-6-polyprenyl-1,4-benzoquinol methylase